MRRGLRLAFPILIGPAEGQVLVLLPLRGPLEVHELAARLQKLPTRLSVKERSVSFEELVEIAPFRWVDGEHGGLAIAAEGEIEISADPPVGGWEAIRADRNRQKVSTRQEISLSA